MAGFVSFGGSFQGFSSSRVIKNFGCNSDRGVDRTDSHSSLSSKEKGVADVSLVMIYASSTFCDAILFLVWILPLDERKKNPPDDHDELLCRYHTIVLNREIVPSAVFLLLFVG
jgi:hypothetical protein